MLALFKSPSKFAGSLFAGTGVKWGLPRGVLNKLTRGPGLTLQKMGSSDRKYVFMFHFEPYYSDLPARIPTFRAKIS